MLTMRRRGKAQIWYIRGRVTLGSRWLHLAEFSTGTGSREVAAQLMAAHEQALSEELLYGPSAVAARGIMADAFEAYLTKPRPPHASDVLRIGVMNEQIGQLSVADPLAAWQAFRKAYLLDHAPAGQDRYRSLLQAAINVYRGTFGQDPVRIKAIAFDNQRVRFLGRADRDRLIGAYAPHVRPIATLFAFQGARTQEALQLEWGADGVDLERGTIHFSRTKTGNARTVAMHVRVEALLRGIWEARGRPSSGHVFLNQRGRPYTDTRDLPVPGGNPLKRAHATACKRAGISGFTVHDWRHHWASHCVMAGIDLLTVMRLGGWRSLRMVQRYAAVDVEHMAAAIAKLS